MNESLMQADVSEIKKGFRLNRGTDSYICLFCGAEIENGLVVPIDAGYYTAERAMKLHISEKHGDAAEVLIGLGQAHTGLSHIQQTLLLSIARGRSDKEIAADLGGKAVSTVRNHRFHMRRRKKEAKVFLAIMELLDERSASRQRFMDFHADLPVYDERIMVTAEEQKEIGEKYFREGGGAALKSFPKKQKAKLVVLNRIAELFDHAKRYTEKEVNGILSGVHEDHVTIRRYLIEYGFLSRKPDGSEYWLT
jgi:DNA-binding CsgD family transcriptional regulator